MVMVGCVVLSLMRAVISHAFHADFLKANLFRSKASVQPRFSMKMLCLSGTSQLGVHSIRAESTLTEPIPYDRVSREQTVD